MVTARNLKVTLFLLLAVSALLGGADLDSDEGYLAYQNASEPSPFTDGVDVTLAASQQGVLAVRLWRSKMSAKLLQEVSVREIRLNSAHWLREPLYSLLVSEQDLYRHNSVYRI